MPVVYVVQEPTSDRIPRDLSSAHRYGVLRHLLTSRDKPSIVPGPVLNTLRRQLKDFKPEDFIVWAGGDPLGMMLVGIVMGDIGLREFQFLRWERDRNTDGTRSKGGYYTPSTVQIR